MKGKSINPGFFKQGKESKHEQTISNTALQRKFQQARRDGCMNLASCQPPLSFVPLQVFQLDAYLEEGEKFWEIEPLKSLDISFNQITELPEEIGQLNACHSIKMRNLSYNQLTSLPEAIGELKDCKELLLNNNALASMPISIFGLKNLKLLDISHNALTTLITTDITHHNNAPTSYNRRTGPPSTASTNNSFSMLSLTTLNLSHNHLTSLPTTLFNNQVMPILENLHVATNNVTNPLPSFQGFHQLTQLDLSQNQLIQFPILPHPIAASAATSAASAAYAASQPTSSKLPSHKLTSSKLSRLNLANNRLSDIADITTSHLTDQASLTELLLAYNHLTVLPPTIENLQCLKLIDISNNDFVDLSPSLGYLPMLSILRCSGNPIRSIRQTLLIKPCPELQAYLRTRGPSTLIAVQLIDEQMAGKPSAAAMMEDEKMQQIQYRLRDIPTTLTAATGTGNSAMSASSAHSSSASSKKASSQPSSSIAGCCLDLSNLSLTDQDLDTRIVPLLTSSTVLPAHVLVTITSINLSQNLFTSIASVYEKVILLVMKLMQEAIELNAANEATTVGGYFGNSSRQGKTSSASSTAIAAAGIRIINLSHNLFGTATTTSTTAAVGSQSSYSSSSNSSNSSSNLLSLYRDRVNASLISLDVSYNQLTHRHLTQLLSTFYPITTSSTSTSSSLQELSIHHNPLQLLPAIIASLMTASLRSLHCQACQLSSLDDPPSDSLFGQLQTPASSLDTLDFSDNKLSALYHRGNWLVYTPNLVYINLENNNLKEIPSTIITCLPQLRTLLIMGNPQRMIRHQIIQQGSHKVIEWLKDKYDIVQVDHATTSASIPQPPFMPATAAAAAAKVASSQADQQYRVNSSTTHPPTVPTSTVSTLRTYAQRPSSQVPQRSEQQQYLQTKDRLRADSAASSRGGEENNTSTIDGSNNTAASSARLQRAQVLKQANMRRLGGGGSSGGGGGDAF